MHKRSDVVDIDGCVVSAVDPAHIEQARAGIPSTAAIEELGATFGLLADPGRLRLLLALRAGETCVCDLAAACGQSESGVSHALRLLRAHRVVAVRRVGRRAYYRLNDHHVASFLELALEHLDHSTLTEYAEGARR